MDNILKRLDGLRSRDLQRLQSAIVSELKRRKELAASPEKDPVAAASVRLFPAKAEPKTPAAPSKTAAKPQRRAA